MTNITCTINKVNRQEFNNNGETIIKSYVSLVNSEARQTPFGTQEVNTYYNIDITGETPESIAEGVTLEFDLDMYEVTQKPWINEKGRELITYQLTMKAN